MKRLPRTGTPLMLSLLAVLAGAAPAQAREDTVPGSRYTSARGAAMGDAVMPFVEDPLSDLFYNPSGIAKIREPQWEMLNLGVQMNQDYVGSAGLNFFKVTSLSSYQSELTSKPGIFPGGGLSLGTGFGFKGFAAGLLFQNQVAATSDGTNIRYRSRYQLIPAVGFGLPLASGVLRLGYSIQWVNQASGDITVPASTSPLGYNQLIGQGSALSQNLAFALTLPYAYLPSFNLVARNFGGARFMSFGIYKPAQNPSGVPATDPFTMDASFSLEPKLGNGATSRLAYVLRDMTGASGLGIMKRSALGMEIDFRGSFQLRAGVASLYPSLGVGFHARRADFNLSWYSEEIGTSLRSQRDIRLLMQFQVRAF